MERTGRTANLTTAAGTAASKAPLRQQQVRNFLATLFMSHGTPLLLGGDELGRTQQGNNNGYCQDSALSWYDWQRAIEYRGLQAFTQALLALRQALPVVRPVCWPLDGASLPDLVTVKWHSVWGMEMTPEEWGDPTVRCVGATMESTAETDLSVMLLFNSSQLDAVFTLPSNIPARTWTVRLDTRGDQVAAPGQERNAPTVSAGGQYGLLAHSMALLTAPSIPSAST